MAEVSLDATAEIRSAAPGANGHAKPRGEAPSEAVEPAEPPQEKAEDVPAVRAPVCVPCLIARVIMLAGATALLIAVLVAERRARARGAAASGAAAADAALGEDQAE